ncbi:hypothetical protein D9756_008990 [Leucocoprinus leucothites]|uniref:Uncharacterized protein n=1 Tax=Leucocoprinus leucothites TaxID=201217 RepID=A0A8H5CY68_9AGAR|nr:hypothetical protein D9756_008990 [Leucoagaricus leucothites]
MASTEGISGGVSTVSRALKSRDIPKLAGSAAGFIALIVVLCLIILTSLIAITLLLREDKASDEEKIQRPKSARYTNALEHEADSQSNSWFRRTYQRLPFARTGSTDRVPSIKFPRPPSRGERPLSPSGEDPDGESRDELYLDVPQPRYINRHPQLERLGHHASFSTGPSTRRLSNTTSMSSVRFETSGIRDIYPHERDKFAPSPTATLPNIHTWMSSPTSTATNSPIISPKRSNVISQETSSINLPTSVRRGQDSTRNSVISTSPSPAPPTFEGGTKFLESL